MPPRPKHAGDLGKSAVGLEPVERLGGKDGVDRAIRERDLLRVPGEHLGLGAERNEQTAHPLVRLDSNHIFELGDEQTRELPGARAQLERSRSRRQCRNSHDLERPSGAAPLVVGVPAAGAARVDVRQRWRIGSERFARSLAEITAHRGDISKRPLHVLA